MGKSVYVVLFREGETLKVKINRVCDSFSSSRFDIPENFESKLQELDRSLEEVNRLMIITKSEIKRALSDCAKPIENSQISLLEFQKWYLAKDKLLYNKLNMLRLENTLLRGICWCPIEDISKTQDKFAEMQKNKPELITKFMRITEHPLVPPTYLKVNEFTWVFQEIVSTYGTPSYREVNPAFFTMVTFPFLFGVMFGDICHGLFLLVIGLYMCLQKDALIKKKSFLAPMLKARYLLLLMGIFATFCGVIYNEFAGLNFNFFNTCYTAQKREFTESFKVTKNSNCVYPLGIDPFWKYTPKQLQFENSLKMKLSVILGVLQMSLGVFMKLANSLEFKKKIDILFEFIPQIIFLMSLFGFMDYLIFAKWLTDFGKETYSAPYVITVVINMFLKFGNPGNDKPLISGQQAISILLLVIVFICVPIMLLPKPYLLKAEHLKKEAQLKQIKENPQNQDQAYFLLK